MRVPLPLVAVRDSLGVLARYSASSSVDGFCLTGIGMSSGQCLNHWGLILAARITLAHISISAAMRAANSFGVLATRS
jgi:hypothetical protein